MDEVTTTQEPVETGRSGRPLAVWVVSALGVAASLAGGLAFYRWLREPAPSPPPRLARRAPLGPWDAWRDTAAPSVTFTTIDGTTIDPAAFHGKHVVVDFWATWCRPCVEAIPELNRLAKEWGDEVVIIGVTDEDRETVAAFREQRPIDYHVVAGVANESLPEPFRRVDALPTLFFIDKEGVFRSVLEGYHHYDCLESRLRIREVAERWAKGERDAALELATRTLEVHIEASVEDELAAIFGDDPRFAAVHRQVTDRVGGLLDLYERKHGEHYQPDRVAVIWVIWNLGAKHRDAEAVPHLLRYLRESTIEEARWRAAEALWLIRDRRAVPDLIAALLDPSPMVAGFSASALGDLGDPAAVQPLMELFHKLPDNRDEAKARVADALGKLGDRRAVGPIAASLDQIHDPAYVRWAAPALDRLRQENRP